MEEPLIHCLWVLLSTMMLNDVEKVKSILFYVFTYFQDLEKTKTTKEWADTSVLLSNFAIPSPPILFWSYLSMLTRWTSQRRADADDIMWPSTRGGRKFQNVLIFLLLRGLKPNQKIQRAAGQPLGQTCPLLYVQSTIL